MLLATALIPILVDCHMLDSMGLSNGEYPMEKPLIDALNDASAHLSSVLYRAAREGCTKNEPHSVFLYMKTMYEHEAKMRTIARRMVSDGDN